MTLRVFIPADAAALSVGADAVARAVADEAARRGVLVEVIRTGSRGLLWLEPLVEVATEQGRLGFGAVRAGEVAGVFDAGFPALGHPRAVGLVEDLVWLRQQTRLTFARVGVTDPLSLGAYRAFGGLAGLEALRKTQDTQFPNTNLMDLALPEGYCGALAWAQPPSPPQPLMRSNSASTAA